MYRAVSGAQANVANESGYTALHLATLHGHAGAAEALLDASAKRPSPPDPPPDPRLSPSLQALLDASADPNAQPAGGGPSTPQPE